MSQPEQTEARTMFLAAYRAWLVRYAIHLAVQESLKVPERSTELLRIRRMLDEDEVLEHGFEHAAMLWLLDVSRLGPFARRINGVVALVAGTDPAAYPHPGAPPTPERAVREVMGQVGLATPSAAKRALGASRV